MEEKKHHINWEQLWLEGKISSEEAAKNSTDASFDAFEKFVEGAKHFDVPRVTSKQQAWQQLEDKISAQQHSPKVISISRRNWLIGVAASFILALGAFFLLPSPESDQPYFNTGLAESQLIYLPDSSSVHLNAVSNVSYSEETWDNNRVVQLEGEAFFDVKRGSKFQVVTSTGTVTVLGTSFNVREREGKLIVACKTGKVGVATSGAEEMTIITPGETVSIVNNEITEVQEINTRRIASWIDNEFDFESMPLVSVFKELERQYNITIECEFEDSFLQGTITATLATDNLKEAISDLEKIKNVKATYSEDGKTIRLK